MRIPTGNFGNVTPQANPTRVSVSNIGQIGNAVAGLGAAIGQTADEVQRTQDKADVAATQAILTDLDAKSSDRWENPETGALVTRQGFKSSGVGLDMDKQDSSDYEEARKRVPQSQLQYFDAQWKAGQVQRLSTYNTFERAQTAAAQQSQFETTVKSSVQQEASAYDDPQAAALARGARKHSIELYGQAQGWSPEQITQAITSADLNAMEQRAQNYAVSNPQGWLAGDFPMKDTGALDMRAIGIVESGGKHFNADGSVITSPAGAQGKYQLMPDTGKELAAKRGVEYNPADEQQNAILASDYANQLYGKYGSETLAGAAYNWGMGNVDKLIDKVGDPRKGEISESEFISKLPSETRGWLARYRKNKTGLDPVSVYKIDNMAQSQIDEQRKALRDQVDPIYNNSLAQLQNGEVPDAMLNSGTIMRAYGEQGAQKVRAMEIALDNAKTFQAIQYVSPEQQQAEIAKLKPQANDPDYALKLDAYGKLGALVQKSNEAIQAQRDTRRFNEALSMGEKLDPTNKSMQKAADATPTAQNFRINDATTHDGIVQQVAQTGIIPSQVTTQLSAISRARSPEAVRQGAELFNRLYDTDPASVGDMPKDMQGFYLTVKQLTDSGMASETAIEQAQNLTYNQTDALKTQLASTQSTKEYKKDRGKAMDSAVSSMSGFFSWGNPSADDQTPEAARFRNDYQSLYDINYRTTGGNADAAKKMTNQQIARTWSISEVNGDAKLMKYAPEALYNYGPSGWQAAQWKEEKENLMYGERKGEITTSPAQLGITSGNAAPVTSKTPESRIGGDLEITPDVLTARNGDYAIMVRTKDKDGIEAVQPFYDSYGRPVRWKPSLEEWAPYKKMQEKREEHDRNELQRGQDIRGFKDKHRALDEQYKRLHNERMDRVKNYFSWSTE
ncbi:transglycosylase SLT domain-containing protein [Enterobacter hormaechei]|uniref:transglycosylase SLT domain-containing protein n=1 Tax=Enterobacter hormaechei TaxID=158836 RepID=UPI0012388E2C|nr:transglycosylase SLT domain-containing protein [Enterobacter hormaechei]MBE0232314.1 lytic transglycosylase domain-containing protein [Enterobacter hormaechei]MCT9066709.1 transglycosylase SLT domain-containing protein [Enterobacter hormaechei subsp. hoffmannii]HAS0972979.1 lytic transglycosylase domain-containing protein [Enterobacter hormaechei]HED3423090.1 transglycosylase SLT domain-containing protein [Enterobacter hormaechei subsp. hoffmannii]HED3495934.1 transglycosylase SLT domain-co